MTSYLRPHLYPDLLDSFKKIVAAEALCNFALSSSEAYQSVARYITMPRTKEVRNRSDDTNFTDKKYRTSILHQTTNGIFVEFTEQYHINQFLYLSGKFCEFMMYACPPKAPWNVSFYEGVAENQCLCTMGGEGRSFAEAYLSKRDTIKELNPGCREDDISDLLEGKIIKELHTEYNHVDDINATRELNVKYVYLDTHYTPSTLFDSFTFRIGGVDCRASPKTLKKVILKICTTLDEAIVSLEKLPGVPCLAFYVDKRFENITSPENLMYRLTNGMNSLWDAILNYPGGVKATLYSSVIAGYSLKEVAVVFRKHHSFKVKEKVDEVKLRLTMTANGEFKKVLKVKAMYLSTYRK